MSSLARDLKTIAVRSRWAYEELVYDAKMTEANRITNRPICERWREAVYQEHARQAKVLMLSLNAMYSYLCEVYGGGSQVLSILRWLVSVQDGPRKTLCID